MIPSEHPLLPRDLVSEIQQFAQSDFARRYFSTHREGLIFRRRVPVERMMMWQKVRDCRTCVRTANWLSAIDPFDVAPPRHE